MKKSSSTYRQITKVTAILLLLAFLIPSGLHAKNFVEFCLMDTSDTEMADQHRDCHPNEDPQDATNDDQASHPDCDWGFICACNIGQSQLGDEEWVPTHKDIEVVLTEGETLSPYSTPSQDIFADRQPRIGEHAPPLWLLYDTFLM